MCKLLVKSREIQISLKFPEIRAAIISLRCVNYFHFRTKRQEEDSTKDYDEELLFLFYLFHRIGMTESPRPGLVAVTVTGQTVVFQDTAILALFPYASDAGTAIASTITAARDVNKRAFQRLTRDVCEVQSVVTSALQQAAEGGCKKDCAKNAGLNKQLQTLISILNPILQFARKRSLISRIGRVILTFKSDGSRIREYREQLEDTLDKFKSIMSSSAACCQEGMRGTLNTDNTVPQTQPLDEQLRSTSHVDAAPESTSPEETASQPQSSSQRNMCSHAGPVYFINNGDVYYYGHPGAHHR
ncbi:hypothetical protein K435DRAFT_834714 [Dendrothele bispora CBS 962.96]|uniref:Uncharacterized protein n=1 Tax=Dendrothele bispora (strain CBS 962.96) TaxID=1314807 RepID=A0A4V4HI87_DENBC|nr:hypothetical protein K435DRAFT_834714 [Dendrothele bispora CBS 962.96]